MLWLGNGAEPSRCTPTDHGAGSADDSRRSDDRTGYACYDGHAAHGDDAADFDDWSANANYDEGRGTGSEHDSGDSGSRDESRNDANG